MVDDTSTENLHKLAISAALNCKWEEALEYNRQLLKLEPENIDALNRTAKAYFELGKYSQAKKIYQQVLELDQYNSIAQKNLKRVSSFKKNGDGPSLNSNNMVLSPSLFLEEPGKTRLVTLIKVAEPQKLMMLSSGMVVNLVAKSRGVSVADPNNQYLGVLPDDIAFHLLKLLEGGNKYEAYIKSVKSNSLTILIREVFRSKKFKNQASFLEPSKSSIYSSDHITLLTDASEDGDEEREETEEIPL